MLWYQVDAHADINTPASSTSGNMHGMPVRSSTPLPSKHHPCSAPGEFSSAEPQLRSDSLDWSSSLPTKVHPLFLIFTLQLQPCSFLFGHQDCLPGSTWCWSPWTGCARVSWDCLILHSGIRYMSPCKNSMLWLLRTWIDLGLQVHWVRLWQGLTQRANVPFTLGASLNLTMSCSKKICLSVKTKYDNFSFDIDVLDPNEAPATGTRVRGGLTLRSEI